LQTSIQAEKANKEKLQQEQTQLEEKLKQKESSMASQSASF